MSLNKKGDAPDLAIGERFTFIKKMPVINEQTEEPIMEGDLLSHWFSTGEPGRIFKVNRITINKEGVIYETSFVGFEIVRPNNDGTVTVTIEETIPKE